MLEDVSKATRGQEGRQSTFEPRTFCFELTISMACKLNLCLTVSILFTKQRGVRSHQCRSEHLKVHPLEQQPRHKHQETREAESSVCWQRDRDDIMRYQRTEKITENKHNTNELPVVVCQCKHLQCGTRRWVGGADHSGPGHTHNSLDDALTQQHLWKAAAWQHPVHMNTVMSNLWKRWSFASFNSWFPHAQCVLVLD